MDDVEVVDLKDPTQNEMMDALFEGDEFSVVGRTVCRRLFRHFMFSTDFADKVQASILVYEETLARERYSWGIILSMFRPIAAVSLLLLGALVPMGMYEGESQTDAKLVESLLTILDEVDLAYMEEQL